MRYLALLLLVLFSQVSFAGKVLVEKPPTYAEKERSPVLVREIGDIGFDRESLKFLTNRLDNEYYRVAEVNGDRIGMEKIWPMDGTVARYVYNQVTREEIYPGKNGMVTISTSMKYPLREGDKFQKLYRFQGILFLVHQCGPVKLDPKSGYIFYTCRGAEPDNRTSVVEETAIFTADMKWPVIPAFGTITFAAAAQK